MKRRVIGILAHVDAGKTTLSEGLLYRSGAIRRIGRVDNQDAFLDTDAQERARGITIFSKQAQLSLPDEDMELTLLDTPGHVDFSAEMERVLQVLDLAILVISGVEGVQPHTKTIWKLLRHYEVPTLIFVNKMDLPTADRQRTLQQIQKELSASAVAIEYEEGMKQEIKSGKGQQKGYSQTYDAGQRLPENEPVKAKLSMEENEPGISVGLANDRQPDSAGHLTQNCLEDIASLQESFMMEFLEHGNISSEDIGTAIYSRNLFPVIFGAALKLEGIDELLQVISGYDNPIKASEELGLYCYKISRDEKGVRLSHIRIFGGCIRVKDMLGEEKINEIRLYSGAGYRNIPMAETGMVVTIPGLTGIRPGEFIGKALDHVKPVLEPVLSYAVRYPSDVDRIRMQQILKEIEEELPELQLETDEEHKELRVSLMGSIQTEILTELLRSRYQIAVHFDVGTISYKETITDVVEGVGHFEPLRHYAEVHLKLEPMDPGSGLVFDSDVSEDLLDKNWQRLIRTHLEERVHRGVLTGSPITDMKITIVGGRAHNKHTEGGDFRQATYRAVRQGLMQAHSRLLEPYYDYTLVLPENYVGRAMTDIDRMHGTAVVEESFQGLAVINGRAPVAAMHTYASQVAAYSKGEGVLTLSAGGYDFCHNEEEVIAKLHYNPEADTRNPASSVFCMHGSGTVIPWNEVFDYMHVPRCMGENKEEETIEGYRPAAFSTEEMELSIGTEEIDEILNRVSHANERKEYTSRKGISAKRLQARREGYYYVPGEKDSFDYSSDGNKNGRNDSRNESGNDCISDIGNANNSSQDNKNGKDSNKENSKKYSVQRQQKESTRKEKYTLVDGYNVIFAWKELKELAAENIDSARDKLLDYMRNYQAFIGEEVIVVFDAYKVPNRQTDVFDYYNIHVVFTRTSQTADQYIERFANQHGRNYEVTVVSSDGLVQLITRGDGCHIISSREFEEYYRRITSLQP